MEDQIYQLVEQLFSVTLDLEIERVSETSTVSFAQALAAEVRLEGAWNGTIALHCSSLLAEKAAVAMFGLDRAAMRPEHVKDALGELTNVLGGNIKRLLPKPTEMSTPGVLIRPQSANEEGAMRVACLCEGALFEVWVVERR